MINLKYGTEYEHIETLKRAKNKNICSIWSGDISRNTYLQENLNFAEELGIIKLIPYMESQESGWNIVWLKNDIL